MSAIGERADGAGAAGFTLIELLVVLGILGLVAGLVFPALERMGRSQRLTVAGIAAEEALRGARADAVRLGRSVRVAPANQPVTPPVRIAGDAITFFADGSSTGGEVTLRDGRRSRRLRVETPSGAIRADR